MARPKGYADWTPGPEPAYWLVKVQEILEEYKDYLPMTNRQIFYRLVGVHGFEKTVHAYKRLCNYLTRARRARLIRFGDIRDDGINSMLSTGWDDLNEFKESIRESAEDYQRQQQEGQGAFIELWCEAEGMMPQMHRVSAPYGVPVYSSGGFLSVTAIYDIAKRIVGRHRDEGRPTVLLHVGDYDPSGESIFDTIAMDAGLFVVQATGELDLMQPHRVALTLEQVQEHNLPTAPPKKSDTRSVNWIGETAQAEAMPPDLLAATVRDAIEARFDFDVLSALRETEEDERSRLVEWLEDLT